MEKATKATRECTGIFLWLSSLVPRPHPPKDRDGRSGCIAQFMVYCTFLAACVAEKFLHTECFIKALCNGH